ncbi:tail fiber assembly protein [Escherichia coli]|nr:tail fiber assembly protein [Escherichia coli]EFN2085471.1 tail fiber assembly protein [Escherichia coli]EFO9252356.1 tail fiber assembly protein [Escherichia coli]EGK5157461.1 tail fiber assembly protein [Escherichia coli]EKQ5579493.1 tail fiber assembly protein [Escherichia coli]
MSLVITCKKYRVLLNRIDTSTAPVDWPPESPDNQYHLNK